MVYRVGIQIKISHDFLLLQIGDTSEMMYFAAKEPHERNNWMEQFRLGKHVSVESYYCSVNLVIL